MSTSAASSSRAPSAPHPNTTVQEFNIRVPKNVKKKFHVMRFNATLNVDFAKWSQVKMERENNMKEYKGFDEDQPRYGGGSEFGREAREDARRKKFGVVARKYKPEDQPWILKSGGRTGKKFKGIREGGVSENASYYVFTHAPDGAIDAYPLQEWYNFQPIQRYKALSAEEAEQEFGRRKKVMNYFQLMLRKRLKPDEEGDAEDPEEAMLKKAGGKKGKELKISEMDEWMDSADESSDSDEEKEKKKEDDDDDAAKKKAKGKKEDAKKKKKKKKDSDDEAFEESDDGDEEGRELDYISDSSDSESDHEGKANKELKSVAEEDALRKLLTSDEDSEDEEKKSGDENDKDEDKNKEKDNKEKEGKDNKSKDKKKKSKAKKKKDDKKDSSSDATSDSSDSEAGNKKKLVKKFDKDNSSGANSRSSSPALSMLADLKRPGSALGASSSNQVSKKPRLDNPPQSFSSLLRYLSRDVTIQNITNQDNKLYLMLSNETGITEEAVRRYLMRKPMTTTELLTKFKSKKTGVSSEKLVETMTQILKRINPVKQTIKGKMYLSIKS